MESVNIPSRSYYYEKINIPHIIGTGDTLKMVEVKRYGGKFPRDSLEMCESMNAGDYFKLSVENAMHHSDGRGMISESTVKNRDDISTMFRSFNRNSKNLKANTYNPFEIKHRKRTSDYQVRVLEKAFMENIKPTAKKRKQLAEAVDMSVRSVQIWFQNRRAKMKSSGNNANYQDVQNTSFNITDGEESCNQSTSDSSTDNSDNNKIHNNRNPSLINMNEYPLSENTQNHANIAGSNTDKRKISYSIVDGRMTEWTDPSNSNITHTSIKNNEWDMYISAKKNGQQFFNQNSQYPSETHSSKNHINYNGYIETINRKQEDYNIDSREWGFEQTQGQNCKVPFPENYNYYYNHQTASFYPVKGFGSFANNDMDTSSNRIAKDSDNCDFYERQNTGNMVNNGQSMTSRNFVNVQHDTHDNSMFDNKMSYYDRTGFSECINNKDDVFVGDIPSRYEHYHQLSFNNRRTSWAS